jgi:hypothetical protein
MASPGFELRGTKAMQRKIERIARDFPNKVEAALRVEAEVIKTISQRDYVPVKDGILKGSAFVNPVEREGDELSVTIGYGGAASAYALRQHEEAGYKHKVGSWKYLELPLRAAIPGMAERIAAKVKV